MNTSLRQVFLVLYATFMLLVCGCTEKYEGEYDPDNDPLVNTPEMFEQAPEDISKIATDETFILSFHTSPETMNPLFISAAYDFFINKLVYDMLFVTDKDLNVFANPNLVDDWFESEDHKVITVKLKEGLKWHDGNPLTAHDFVFTMEMLKNPKVPAVTFKADIGSVDKVEALDDLTIRYTLNKSIATRLDTINMPYAPLPKHLYKKDMENNPDLKQGKYYRNLAINPVGNGPYKLVEWVENDRLVFERWEDYPGKKPYIKRFIYKIIPDLTMARLAFESGDTDGMFYFSPKQCARESNGDKFSAVGRKYVMRQWIYDYMGWNMDGSNPFFIDRRVRVAMAHCHNFELLKSKLAYNMITECYGCFHPNSWMFNEEVEPFRYDLEKASALLDDAGWVLESDGWRYKEVGFVIIEVELEDKLTKEMVKKKSKVFVADNGEYECKENEEIIEEGTERRKFEFTYLSTPSNGLPRATTIIYQQDLRKIGVDMNIRLLEWTSFMQRVLKHDMQSWGAAWGSGTDPDGSKGIWRVKDYDEGRNYGGYANPEVDSLFEAGMVEFDKEKRAKIYQKIHKVLYEDQPYLYSDNRLSVSVIHKRFRGMFECDFGFCYTYPYTRELWVPKDEASRPVKE